MIITYHLFCLSLTELYYFFAHIECSNFSFRVIYEVSLSTSSTTFFSSVEETPYFSFIYLNITYIMNFCNEMRNFNKSVIESCRLTKNKWKRWKYYYLIRKRNLKLIPWKSFNRIANNKNAQSFVSLIFTLRKSITQYIMADNQKYRT